MYGSLEAALEAFKTTPDTGETGEGTETFGGTIGSPSRLEGMAGVALELGKETLARKALEQLLGKFERWAEAGSGFGYEQRANAIREFLDK